MCHFKYSISMKKYLVKLASFCVFVIIIDFFIGLGFTYMRVHTKGGDTGLANYIHEELKDEVLFFGSSRCFHHYDPNIISDSLEMSCYNCGMDGMGILYFYQRFKLITERYSPKLIVYDIHPKFDLLVNEPDNKYLGGMRAFYNHQSIRHVFEDVDSYEPYKMMSNAYRYNSKLLPYFSDMVAPSKSSDKGYRPKDKVMKYEPSITSVETPYNVDSLKIKYFELLIKECQEKGIQLVLATSPIYKGYRSSKYDIAMSLANKHNIPYLLHVNEETISRNKIYFYDSSHMNRKGATEYSKMIAHELKKILK